jgi:hypothetical protein
MWLRHEVSTCAQLPFAERLPRGIPDADWIPAVAELGMVAITNNRKTRTNPVEAGIAVASGARIIGPAGKAANGTSWDKATLSAAPQAAARSRLPLLLTRHWHGIESSIAEHPDGPWWLAVTQFGTRQAVTDSGVTITMPVKVRPHGSSSATRAAVTAPPSLC